MANVTTGHNPPTGFATGETVTASKLNNHVNSATVTNIVNADIAAGAAISDTKLATISTAGKVANSATTATNANTASAIVARDASGNFSAGTITANLTGNVTGNVTGNLTGTASAIADNTVTSAKIVDGTIVNADINASAAIADTKLATISTAGKVANSATTATNANTASTIVARDASGNFSAGTITANLTGTASAIADNTVTNAKVASNAAIADTKLATISTAGKVANSATTATSNNTNNAIVARDASGNFSAGTITANLTGNVTGNVTGNLTGTASAIADNTVTSAKIVDGTIEDADINASAAISGTKISPNFGSQNIATTGTHSSGTIAVNTNGDSVLISSQKPIGGVGQNIFLGGGGQNVSGTAPASNGSYNVSLGVDALQNLTSGQFNIAIGHSAAKSATTSQGAVIIGFRASQNATLVSSPNNTIIGTDAGPLSHGFGNNTCLGYQAGNGLTISNTVVLGNSSVTALRCQVQTITSLSDKRDKKEITDIPVGLDFLKALQPRSFVWNMRDGGKINVPEFGFIAQEIQEAQKNAGVVVPNLVDDSNPDYLAVGAGTLIPILVKAVQELATRVAALEASQP
jgi:trimeric autotransporter adhesin